MESALIDGITKPVILKTSNVNFALLLHWTGCYHLCAFKYFDRFVLAVNESSSSVQRFQIDRGFICNLRRKFEKAVYTKFLKRVVCVERSRDDFRTVTGNIYSLLDRNVFPILKRLCYKDASKVSRVLRRICSLDINHLQISINESILLRFPGSLQ